MILRAPLRTILTAAALAMAALSPNAAAAQTTATTPVNPMPPAAITGSGTNATTASATVNGIVDTHGAETTYRFEYGTSVAYGLNSPTVTLPPSGAPVEVNAALTGLTAGTVYHFRVVATNAAGTITGGDGAFKTTAPVKVSLPSAQTRSVRDLSSTGATLVGRINPQGSATTYSFDYGPTRSYGSSTPAADAGSGKTTVELTTTLGGLAPNTKVYYRVVARNAAGVRHGNAHTFTTSRDVAALSIRAATSTVTWNGSTAIGGIVSGAGVGGVKVNLLRQDFPFTNAYRVVASQTTNVAGAYGFTVGPLYSRARFKVATDTATPFTSAEATVKIGLLAKLRISARTKRTVTLRGLTYPAVPKGRISIQRQTRAGRWILVRRVSAKPVGSSNRSGYTVRVSRYSKTTRYRAVITPSDGGEHERTTAKSVRAPKR